jgi:hypothetical protein
MTYILAGERKANELSTVVVESLGLAKHTKVESKRQTIIEGPPAVGKSFSTKQTCVAYGVQPIEVTATSTPSEIAAKFAYADYWTPKGQEIVVIYDDADEPIFGEKKTANTWKRVFTDDGDFPEYNHNVNMTGTINGWKKDPNKASLVQAVEHYISEGSLGISIPMDRFRHIVLTNTDWETEVEKKSKAHLAPVIDRFKYSRLKYEWTTAWGWLSYVLLTTQPFEQRFNISLTEEEKVKIITWIFVHWDKMGKKQTYRTVKEMAEYLINEPDNAHNRWQKFIRM